MPEVASSTLPAEDPGSVDITRDGDAVAIDVHVRGSHRAVGPVALALMVYFSVSGGPLGSEGIVRAGGIMFGCLGFIIIPWIYSFPVALMTAELASTWPEDGGFIVFTSKAMGPLMGWIYGYSFLVSGIIDTAIYPSLMLSYVLAAVNGGPVEGESLKFTFELLCRVSLVIILSYVVYRGVKTIEAIMSMIGGLLIAPLVIMVLMSTPHWDPGVWVKTKSFEDIDWTVYLNVVVWNVCGWEGVASYAGEVKDPGRTYPRAMTICMVTVTMLNGLSMLSGVCIDPEPSNWNEGHFITLGIMVAGHWLGVCILLAACATCAATFVSIQNQNSYMMVGMAQQGMLPRALQVMGKRNTPYVAILTCATATCIISVMSFEEIVGLEMLFLALGTQVEVAVFLILRVKHKNTVRPYTMPGSTTLRAFMFLLPPVLVSCVLLFVGTIKSKLLGLAVLLTGAVIYFVGKRCRGMLTCGKKEVEDTPDHMVDIDSQLLQEIQLEPLEGITNRKGSSPSLGDAHSV